MNIDILKQAVALLKNTEIPHPPKAVLPRSLRQDVLKHIEFEGNKEYLWQDGLRIEIEWR